MTRPLGPADVLCKDGFRFSIRGGGTSAVVITAPFHDADAQRISGLGRYRGFHGDGTADFRGMGAETVRAFIRAHGGFADAGTAATASLQALPGARKRLMLPPLNPAAKPA